MIIKSEVMNWEEVAVGRRREKWVIFLWIKPKLYLNVINEN